MLTSQLTSALDDVPVKHQEVALIHVGSIAPGYVQSLLIVPGST